MVKKQGCAFCDFKEHDVVVYEDEVCYAVISARPINGYHVLVIPREHYIHFVDLPEEVAVRIFQIAKKVSAAVRLACRPDAVTHVSDDDIHGKGYNEIEHYKFHIIPRFDNDKVRIDWGREEDPGLAVRRQYAERTRAVL